MYFLCAPPVPRVWGPEECGHGSQEVAAQFWVKLGLPWGAQFVHVGADGPCLFEVLGCVLVGEEFADGFRLLWELFQSAVLGGGGQLVGAVGGVPE